MTIYWECPWCGRNFATTRVSQPRCLCAPGGTWMVRTEGFLLADCGDYSLRFVLEKL